MKKILNYSLILFVFCLTSLLGGFFIGEHKIANAATTSNAIEISSATELKAYIDGYGTGAGYGLATDNIVLTANIDMSELSTTQNPDGDIVYNTIGTETLPFAGIFDGRGYTISNLRIDTSVDTSENGTQNNQYAGLFGVTNGASIKNIALSGNLTLTTGGCVSACVGGLVAKAVSTDISYCQVVAQITHNTLFDCNINFGSLAGYTDSSTIGYVVCRSSQGFSKWTFDRNDNKVFALGGIVGRLSNSQISFSVVSTKFNANIKSEFVGDLSIGGIVGSVGQGGSKIINIACENTILVTNNALTNVEALINVGEIAGVISNPAPKAKNISYIHYKANNGVGKFGDIGDYSYTDTSVYDYITESQYALNQLESLGTPEYFANQIWHDLYGVWDFEKIWYVGSSSIYLQSFYGDFYVGISANLNTDILTMTSTLKDGYRFGDTIDLDFNFNSVRDGETVIGNMSQYYSLSSVSLNGVEKAKIITYNDGTNVSYRISGCDALEITKHTSDVGFTLTIKNVNKSTAGDYNVITTAKTFSINITSRLYKGDNSNELVEGSTPGYVFYADGGVTDTTSLNLSSIKYGFDYRFETRVKANTPNSFVGWYLVSADGKDKELSKNRILQFTFGSGDFVGNCEIYAKYKDNACIITFKLGDGIIKIDLYSGGVSITKTGETTAVSKEEASLKLELYLEKGYDFDVQQFITDLDVYKTEDPTKTFCTLRESYETEEYQYFHFILDMTTLKADDFENSFSISAQTTPAKDDNSSWIWIAVGAGGGVILIVLIIVIIVLVSRRRSFGGGSSGGSFKKKNYKNMYF